MVTPNRPDATCLTAERRLSPEGRGTFRAASSPPSPQLLRAPRRFIATATVSCASIESDPNDIADETNRFTIDPTGSTSSRGTAAAGAKLIRLRSVTRERDRSSMIAVYSLKSR